MYFIHWFLQTTNSTSVLSFASDVTMTSPNIPIGHALQTPYIPNTDLLTRGQFIEVIYFYYKTRNALKRNVLSCDTVNNRCIRLTCTYSEYVMHSMSRVLATAARRAAFVLARRIRRQRTPSTTPLYLSQLTCSLTFCFCGWCRARRPAFVLWSL